MIESTSARRFCLLCGAELPAGASFCVSCGANQGISHGALTLTNSHVTETVQAGESDQHRAKLFAQIQEWMRKLVDLSRRNRLLFFKSTRSSTLQIIEPLPAEVFNRLILEQKSWKFYKPLEEESEPPEDTSEERKDETEPLKDVSAPRRREPDEIKCVAETPVENVLKNLYRRAHTEYEERGIRILHIAFGMLKWREQEQSEIVSSPLLLVPVELKRESAAEPLQVSLVEEEVILNPALKIRFWNDFHIELPEPDDWENETLQEYLDSVSKKVSSQGYSVIDECWIALFSFHKLPIYNDLNDHGELIIQRPLVCALGGVKALASGELVDPSELDTVVEPRQSLVVLDADSSQLASIESIKKGGHLIIQGPPGTGKSQTIVNLIAEFVSRGKSVLFVSEKMAALDVVYKRIKDRGLGHLCLELHSDKANKRVVVEELHRCYQQSVEPRTIMTENDLKKLESTRTQLNRYVKLLHQVQEPLGLTPYQALSELARLKDYPAISLSRSRNPANLTMEQIEHAIDLTKRLGAVWTIAVEGESFPWAGSTCTQYSWDLRARLSELLNSCLKATQDLQEKGSEIATRFGLAAPESLSDLWFIEIGKLLHRCLGVPRILLIGKGDSFTTLRNAKISDDRWGYVQIVHNYDRGIIEDFDLDQMIRVCSSRFRWLLPQFHIGRTRLKRLRLGKKIPQDIPKDLRLASQLKKAIEWASLFRSRIRSESVPNELLDIAESGSNAAPDLTRLEKSLESHNSLLASLESQFESGYPKVNGAPLRSASFRSMQDCHNLMLQRIDSLRDWVDYRNIEKDFAEMTLHDLFARLVRLQVNPSQLPMVVRKSLLQDWVDWLFAKEPVLGQFRCTQHEQLVEEFRDLDRMHWRLGPHQVAIDAARFRPPVTTYPESEAYVLAREALKKRRHLPLRKLFPLISNLLLRIKPCLLMSPLSVSQFLDPKLFTFDLVIFDEASQVRTEDSIGAIYRGRQVVVCGDDKQLPPTSFFEEILSDEFYEHLEETFDEYESILQACAVAGMRQQMLRWHYRSRHESLIAFSNHQFYGDKLVTFPSAVEESQEFGVKFIHAPDGVYDRGGKRDNKREAEKVLELVKAHFRECPTKSLGVVSFSISQTNTIEDYVEQMRRDHPEFEPFFVENRLEGFFVKNLENVQGDERDVLIFSVGYGRDQHGRLTMNFGPLNREGGERRLNVAITRAREKVYLVSSIKAEDFNLSDARAPGVLQLYKYLQYAEIGPQALELSIPSHTEYESPLEDEVAKEIRNFGYDVKAQVGCSGYRIDLGVIDPEKPGKFILGVECDGATYHSAYTARDRDRIRQEVLEKLGWRIHRIWAPDFVTRRDTEVRRLKEAIEHARNSQRAVNQNSNDCKDDRLQLNLTQTGNAVVGQNAGWTVFYEACVPHFRPPWNTQFHEATGTLGKLLREIVEKEGPVHVEISARRLAEAWGLHRIGGRMSVAIDDAIRYLLRSRGAMRRGDFLWPMNEGFQLQVRKPNPDDGRTIRSVRQIPPEEIELAFTKILEEALSMPREALITQVGRLFGLGRIPLESQNLLEQILIKLTSQGSIIEKEGRLGIAIPERQGS